MIYLIYLDDLDHDLAVRRVDICNCPQLVLVGKPSLVMGVGTQQKIIINVADETRQLILRSNQ